MKKTPPATRKPKPGKKRKESAGVAVKKKKVADQLIDDDSLNLEAHDHAASLSARDLERLEKDRQSLHQEIRRLAEDKPGKVVLDIQGKQGKKRTIKFAHRTPMAFARPLPKLRENFRDFGGMLIKTKGRGKLPVFPEAKIAKHLPLFPWRPRIWDFWEKLIPILRCLAIPPKPGRVEIPMPGSSAMVKVSRDCSRAFVVNNQGHGSVVNVLTENVEASFQVAPNPSPARPHPPAAGAVPVVSPFIKGGLNHKYRRLYVPASFYAGDSTGGFYVAVVDVNPGSATYLNTIGWVDCGWLPEQVSFTADGETGVVTNYMEGTVTIFRVSDHTPLNEVALFPGAGVDQLNPGLPGTNGTFARSVVTTKLPGKGNVALASLTDTTGHPGFAMVELDTPGNPRTNFTHAGFGFIDGIAVTPQKDRVLLVDATNDKLHVYKIQGSNFVFEKSISLPASTFGSGRVYMGGIACRPTGNLAFLGTGRSTVNGINALTCVNYVTGTVFDLPDSIANGTWDLVIRSFGLPIKPYIFVVSTSGRLTIIPC